ncbi:hypothetical protein SARC_07029 [Sphaeroforma arctica JP610]|uniref:Uncharacterized protein n=1 Tax=Sphaeroforma arctica JP610 TaxID=667725 RepID=A0A0L0FUV4_9EUKA|nr:hypothetical protein SARC_07029 [Sphaeroforma arctica JP610]KNC80620.1 hypothetical protein SARC_07029 [Sphaeroforma arctica JP610]|eukprot:XP_014154522.1 hypothetical protein SARC_07029 [Sphaeroforma arctica JP610]
MVSYLVAVSCIFRATSDSSREKSMVGIHSPEELLMPLDDIVNSARALAQSQRKINDPAQETQYIHIEGTKHMFSIFQLSDTPCRRVVAMAACECVRPVLDMKFISPALSEHLEEVRQVVGTAYLSTGPPR